MEEPSGFDPAKFLTRVNGAEYLEVKWRVVWLRERAPDADLVTEAIQVAPDFALFKATISIPGGGRATGYGSESKGDFRDFIEKAETKAIGRACAALGFGTQFTKDFDYGADQGRMVDQPVRQRGNEGPPPNGNVTQMRQQRDQRAQPQGGQRVDPVQQSQGEARASEAQLNLISRLNRELGYSEENLDEWIANNIGVRRSELSVRQASSIIDDLNATKRDQQRGQG